MYTNNRYRGSESYQHGCREKPAHRRPIASGIILALGLALGSTLAAPVFAEGRPVFPLLKFHGKARGSEALQRLGNKLPDVAAWYRMTPERLAEILDKDRNAWLDETGHLLFIDEFTAPPPPAGTVATTGGTVGAAPYALTDTFLLHSKPGSQRVLYLDFNGHTTTGSAWNSGTIAADPFDLDGIPSAFSDAELERIQFIWQRVTEDYAPFDIDVTTEEPAADALNRTSSTDQTYGSRVVVTRNNFGACTSCGGIAYVGVFDYFSSSNPAYYQPAWVFFDALGAGNEKYVAEAISHEAGHNLGLSHDGTSTVGYYQGHGTGATGWAPIMGVGYYKELVQWSKGEYPNANNFEDDFAVIQTNGAALKADDVGSTLASAAPLAGTAGGGLVTVSQGGLIERSTDLDYFSLSSGTGPLQITVTPDARSPNLDASIELLDAAGTVIASANPADALNATITADIPAGGYYLKINGVGKGDLTSGYSDYASVGHYSISGTYASSNAVAPVAVASATPISGYAPLNVGFSSNGSSDADGSIVSYFWNFGDSTSSAEVNPLHTYATPGTYNPVLTVTDSQGLTHSTSLAISVAPDPLVSTLHVDNIALTSKTSRAGGKTNYQCVASVSVKNYAGGLTNGAAVSGNWSGVTTSKIVTATTGTNGVATFTSAKTTSRGTCTFSVSGVTLSGWTYDAKQNLETSDSLTY
ncbi:PKD domain-containing protein [Methylococcus sp. EFPC2]|uniref:PKD domain-containing protein n=1 Tax=Methylococcus sp. EFPC2 TaxID=2812648 RepID=UPI0019687C15|nr:PKD domain-containing protein [Methylococcus sp. EFPC2]QSA96099.1 PKD domain-containing protein [Methylococcus sp. EFPC2]